MPASPTSRAEISRHRLTGNFLALRSLAQQQVGAAACDLLAVVKADAYGHSVALCAPWLVDAGAAWLGVSSAEEGALVRRLCPHASILVMGGLQPGDAATLLDANLVPTVWDTRHLQILAQAAQHRALPAANIPIHIEIDTGMSRQGVSCTPRTLDEFFRALNSIPALRVDGLFTHFASAEVLDAPQNTQQIQRFQDALEHAAAAGLRPEWIHAGNSSTILGATELPRLLAMAQRFNAKFLLRPGISLYGYALPLEQNGEFVPLVCDLRPVLRWTTSIATVRPIEPGTQVGYNGTFIATEPMRLALLPIGYADGLNRKLSNRGHVLVHGTRAPFLGRVSMDLSVIDVTHLPHAAVGDEVVVLGEQGSEILTADEHARWTETISYEILCAISSRVPRIAAP